MADTLGKVYFYNLFNEEATLSLNGGPAGTINGWDAKTYQPSSVAVGSAKHKDEATGLAYRGGDGSNSIEVQWLDGIATGTIVFPTDADDVRLTDDLVCYIAKNQAFVETIDGFVKPDKNGNQPLTFAATT